MLTGGSIADQAAGGSGNPDGHRCPELRSARSLPRAVGPEGCTLPARSPTPRWWRETPPGRVRPGNVDGWIAELHQVEEVVRRPAAGASLSLNPFPSAPRQVLDAVSG